MDKLFTAGVINNLSILIALCFFYRRLINWGRCRTFKRKCLCGFFWGVVIAAGMLFPVAYSSGIYFDGCTAILSIIAVLYGAATTMVAAGVIILLRILQGGVGIWMGIGAVICAAVSGLLYHEMRIRYSRQISVFHLYLFGIVVHLLMLACVLALPQDLRRQVLYQVALPVMLIYPAGTLFFGILMLDIEQRAAAETALQDTKVKLQAMFTRSFLFSCLLTPEGRLYNANRTSLEFIGYEEEALAGCPFWETPWWPEKEKPVVKKAVERAAAGQYCHHEMVVVSKTNEEYIYDVSIKPVTDGAGRLSFILAEGWDITKRKKMESMLKKKAREIRSIAYADPLTSLPNRAYLAMELGKALEKARREKKPGTVLFIDVDDLKMINDTFGHSYGDHVIANAGMRLRNVVDKSKAFLARIGGDEFIVILYGEGDRQRSAGIADKIMEALRQEQCIGGEYIKMSASIGIAIYPEDGDSVEDILKNADNALYAAKRNGKNCWSFYEATMQDEAYEKMILTNSLRFAVERQELLLHYQPQVHIASGEIVGFEALLRWNSPEHGLVSPGRFVPLAEQCGLIRQIGQWVLREACYFAKYLSDAGYKDMHIAVNVSAHQLTADDFVDSIAGILSATGVMPKQLEIEITESIMLSSVEIIIRKLELLSSMGVSLSLDDFGAGYSSLTYLQRLPVNILKIDKSFIDMILMDKAKPAIIASIVNMAHILNMTVVAEGVEKKEQLDYLGKQNCDMVQGYFISRPLPQERAIEFLIDMKKRN
jgi:diguanylate cyclase (GGDEF)-like protein/PAS domain S-box-containing protein